MRITKHQAPWGKISTSRSEFVLSPRGRDVGGVSRCSLAPATMAHQRENAPTWGTWGVVVRFQGTNSIPQPRHRIVSSSGDPGRGFASPQPGHVGVVGPRGSGGSNWSATARSVSTRSRASIIRLRLPLPSSVSSAVATFRSASAMRYPACVPLFACGMVIPPAWPPRIVRGRLWRTGNHSP